MARKVTIFSGNRAEWSHLSRVRAAIPDARLIVTDTLLASTEIENVHAVVSASPTRTLAETVSSMAGVQRDVGRILAADLPDVLLLYGDRAESAAAGIAGYTLGIPVAHIEGGDWTEGGCADDGLRHVLTKLASLHFATNADSAIRIVGMGEEAWRVHDVGLPVLDTMPTMMVKMGNDPVAVFCMHPVGGKAIGAVEAAAAVGRAHDAGWSVIAIRSNGDAGSDTINGIIDRLAEQCPRVRLVDNVTAADYHGMLRVADCVVGNSSAGIKEAPAFGCPCVNVGDRQKGRLRGENVIDVGHDSDAIYAAMQRCATDRDWRRMLMLTPSPYGRGGASKRIAAVLEIADLVSRKKVSA